MARVPSRWVGTFWLLAGIVVLITSALLVAGTQIGEAECAVCPPGGGTCTGSTTWCPWTGALVALDAGVLAVGPAMAAIGWWIGTAPGASDRRSESDRSVQSSRRKGRVALEWFVALYGGGWVLSGLLLPLSVFGYCHEGCAYPYVLQGTPLSLVLVGGVASALGLASLAIDLRRLRSVTRPRARSLAKNPPAP